MTKKQPKKPKKPKTVARASPINSTDGMSSKDVLSSVAAAVAVLAALSFISLAAREWAYYFGLGATDFISLTSPATYTSAALRGLPIPLLFFVVGGVLTRMLIGPIFPPQSDGKRSRRPLNPWLGYLAVSLVGVPWIFLSWFIYVKTGFNPATSLIFPWALECWGLFMVWFFTHPPGRYDRLGRKISFPLFCGPLVFAWIVAGGYDEAFADLALERGGYRIVRSNGLVEDDVQLLRATSNGVLILRVPTQDISFLTYGSFNRIEQVAPSQ